MEIFGENLWLTILFWLVIVIIIALLIFCCVSHFIKKGEQPEEQMPWYTTKAIIEPMPNYQQLCGTDVKISANGYGCAARFGESSYGCVTGFG